MLYEFQKGNSGSAAARNICDVLGEGSATQRTCAFWFNRFRSGDTSLQDRPKSGRPVELNMEELRRLVESDPRQTTRELAARLSCVHSTVERHLHEMGKVHKLGCWIPHELSQDNIDRRIDTCHSLLSRSRRFDWLRNIITGDEKWVLYVNHTRKRQWVDSDKQPEPEPKTDLHPKKVMLSVWWDFQGVIHFELLPPNTSIDATLYCSQLERLQVALLIKRPGRDKVILQHDNARPHTAKKTREKLKELGWEVLPHPAYSPDLAPSDYHLFRSLQNHLDEKRFDNRDELQRDIEDFFASKPARFYEEGIMQLPDRWRQVVDMNGTYIVD